MQKYDKEQRDAHWRIGTPCGDDARPFACTKRWVCSGAVARVGSYRQYGESDLDCVRLIRQAQALGSGLSELMACTPCTRTKAGAHRSTGGGRRASVARGAAVPAGAHHRLAGPGSGTARL